MVANNLFAAEPAKLWRKIKLIAEEYELDAETDPGSNMSVYQCSLIPASFVGNSHEKVLELANGFEVDPLLAGVLIALARGRAQSPRAAGPPSDDVALVAADLRLPGVDGVEFLERARAWHRDVVRALLVAMDEHHTRISFSELETLQHATALGRIDFWVVKGWVTPEEWLYPQVQEALSAWTRTNRPRHVLYRIIGERWEARTHALRDMLTRNSVPFEFYPVDSEEGDRLVEDFGVDAKRLPAVIRHDGSVLHDPTFAEVAGSHGIHTRPSSEVYDLAILEAGPAGLAAAVYGASEGLSTLVVEPLAIGGQAGTSSMIRNYLGFPRGLGGELAHRAWEQAVLFGAQFVFTQPATGLATHGREHMITLSGGSEVSSRAVIIAAGVAYRRIGVPSLESLVGAGVFYGAAGAEAPAMAGEEVYVVGGANSAGQAALHLAKFAARVTLLVRGESLAAGKSDYLIRQIEATLNLEVRLRTRGRRPRRGAPRGIHHGLLDVAQRRSWAHRPPRVDPPGAGTATPQRTIGDLHGVAR